TGVLGFNLSQIALPNGAPTYLVAEDFNRDGNVDVAIANSYTVALLVGDGKGNFGPSSVIGTAASGDLYQSLAVGDFNGDGNVDLAVVSYWSLSLLLGVGAGKFTQAPSISIPGGSQSVAAGDFDGDGKLDVAIVTNGNSQYPGMVAIRLG